MAKQKYCVDHYDRLTELALIVHKLWLDSVDVSSVAIQKNIEYSRFLGAGSVVGITWQEVQVAAGIPTEKIFKKKGKPSKYSKDHYDRITELALIVHKLWKSGVDVSTRTIQKNPEYRKLISSAASKGITWQEVQVAAGVPLAEVIKKKETRYWCVDHYDRLTELALEVHKLWLDGLDVTSNAIKQNAEYGKLISAARTVGISWQEVQVAAGIPTEKIFKKKGKPSKYSKDHYDRITELALIVHKLWKSGVDVSVGAIRNSLEYRKLLSASSMVGITWREVEIAAGIPTEEIITKKDIHWKYSMDHYNCLTELALIVYKLWKTGVDVSFLAIKKNSEYSRLITVASRKGITWQEVQVAAGLPLDEVIKRMKIREWCEDHYDRITELALIVHKLWLSGVDVTASAIINNAKYKKLISAATYAGITWQEVQVAAGIPTEEIFKKKGIHLKYSIDHYDRLTELALIVHRLWKSDVDVSARAIQKSLEYRKLLSAAGFVGITWQEVLVAAGIPLTEVMKDIKTRFSG